MWIKDSEISHITAHNNFILKKKSPKETTEYNSTCGIQFAAEHPKMIKYLHDSINVDYALSSRLRLAISFFANP